MVVSVVEYCVNHHKEVFYFKWKGERGVGVSVG